ncbi:uncharacterized protein [Argopecten irradians]|uniref:uncharacterized protein n=1 Tax=Argopecten irradians TaxID=31199 RepID=UPI0037232963
MRLLEVTRDCFYTQHVKRPTRIRENQIPSLLHLILTNEEGMITNIKFNPGLGKSDHLMLEFDILCYAEILEQNIDKRNFLKGNYVSINKELAEHASEDTTNMDANEHWTHLMNILSTSIEKHVPLYKRRSNDIRKPYINKDAISAVKKKHQEWTKYLHCKTDNNYQSYKIARNKATRLLRLSQRSYEKSIAENIKDSPKLFWNYVRSKTKTKSTITRVNNPNGDLTETDKETAEVMNDSFVSVFVEDGNTNLPPLPRRNITSPLIDFEITEEIVLKALSKQKPNKSPGPDGIHPKLLLETKDIIVKPLTSLFKKSIEESVVPK